MTVKKILRPRDIIKYGRRDWYYVHLPKLLTGQLYGKLPDRNYKGSD